MLKAQAVIQDALGIEATARLKTVNTIVEKLRRERTRLAEMQDIGGLRIVKEMSITDQDQVVTAVAALLSRVRIQDRRSSPSYGYRAVHLIGVVDEHQIEIQIRTELQDGWAQAFEKLADVVGRDVRYGGEPTRSGDEARSLVRFLQRLSRVIAESEMMDPQNRKIRDDVAMLKDRIRSAGENAQPSLDARIEMEALQSTLEGNERRAAATAAAARDLLDALGKLLSGMISERR